MSFHVSEISQFTKRSKFLTKIGNILQIPRNSHRELSNSREFPAIFGVADSREFPGIPEREFPVALLSGHSGEHLKTYICNAAMLLLIFNLCFNLQNVMHSRYHL